MVRPAFSGAVLFLACCGALAAADGACEDDSEACPLADGRAKAGSTMLQRQPPDGRVMQRFSEAQLNDKDNVGLVSIKVDSRSKRVARLSEALQKPSGGGSDLSDGAAACLKIAIKTAEALEKADDPSGATDPNTPEEEKLFLDHAKLKDAEGDYSKEAFYHHYDAILKALETYSQEVTPEQGLLKGCVLTNVIWEELTGIPGTPEANPACVQGDMCGRTDNATALLQEAAKSGARWAGDLWPDPANVPYCLGSTLSTTKRAYLQDAIQHFENLVPCLGFRQIDVLSDTDRSCTDGGATKTAAIYIGSFDSGCYANVGAPFVQGGVPSWSVTMNLGNGCETFGIIAHELGHNLGMTHEQSRPDVAKYIRILWDNILPSEVDQYETSTGASTGEPYDIMSLMHYGDTDFAKTGADGQLMKTMEDVQGRVTVMGNRLGLTQQDALQLGKMYGCEAQVKNFKMCTNDPSQCTKEACGCHQDATKNSLIIKTSDEKGCFRCLEKCPMYNTGSPTVCGCPKGMAKGSFESGGETYNYCKEPPAPAPPRSPAGSCKDTQWWCNDWAGFDEAKMCSNNYLVNGLPVLQSCPKRCGCRL